LESGTVGEKNMLARGPASGEGMNRGARAGCELPNADAESADTSHLERNVIVFEEDTAPDEVEEVAMRCGK